MRECLRSLKSSRSFQPLLKCAAILALAILIVPIAQAGTNPNAPLGTNLSSVTDFSDEFPFVDLMKSSREWIPGNATGCFDCRTPGTNANCLAPNACPVTVNTDANGYLTSLLPNQVARLVVHAGNTPGRLASGNYTMRFDGAGAFSFFGASPVSSAAGEAVFNIASSTGNNILINFTAITAANPIRNIKILPPGGVCSNDDRQFCSVNSDCAAASATCRLYTTPGVAEAQVFQPRFLRNTDPFRVLRYMDWMETNNSPIVSVADYPTTSSALWHRVPISVLADLGNRTASDIWINIPHRANDALVDSIATILRDQFRADRKIYIEYSNENWNGIFSQNRGIPRQFCPGYADLAAGCQNDGIPGNGIACELDSNFSLGPAGPSCLQALVRGWGDRSVQIFDRFDSIFGSQARQRLVRVIAAQAANPDVGRQIMVRNATGQSFTVASKTDAYASAPYIGTEYCTPGGINPDTSASVYTDVDSFLNHFENQGMARALGFMTTSKAMLTNNFPSLRHVAYEGGQHLAGVGNFTFNNTCNTIFDAANRHPRIEAIYETYFANWKQNGDEMAHFSNVGRYSVFGRWTLLEFQDQDVSTAPKYRAMLDHSAANPCHWSGCTQTNNTAPNIFANGFE
jgi:hypothetical protein